MARTNATAVRLILDTDLTSPQLEEFITDASLWVDNNITSGSLSAAILEAIEKYLAAHFACLRDPRLTQARLGDVAETYQRGKEASEYLKVAAALDTTGAVADKLMEGRPRLMFRVGEGYDATLDLPETST